ncbi:MAG: glycosyltransferase family 4 protein [Deltaproteobacteria bacterium]|nr:glycosyltransferase family 4 protein [Deltaproteobacteria bacterium]
MAKLVWASLDDYLPPGKGFGCVGRSVANHAFFQALMRYGRFDEYHFFLANGSHRRAFETGHGGFLESVGASKKVRLFDRLDLPEQVSKYDYTVFHQGDHITYFNSLCHFRNRSASFPVTAFIHSLSYQSFMSTYLQMTLGGVTCSDALICSSVSGKKVLENCFGHIARQLKREPPSVQMEVIPLGVDGGGMYKLSRRAARKRLGLDEKEVIGLCFGRFSDYDKMDLFPLLQAFQMILRAGRPWRLILAGAVHVEAYLEILKLWARVLGVSNRVTFLTNLSEEEKAAVYGAADFFTSVSDNPQETFGITLLEAMGWGLPLLVSDFDGYREIVTEDVGRRIATTWGDFEPFWKLSPLMDEVTLHRYLGQSVCVDVEGLADGLEFFFSDPDRCREMGMAARERFLRLYDSRVIIPRLEALWTRLKEGFRPGPGASCEDPLAMKAFPCFSHYVTQTLSHEMRIRTTRFGRSLLASEVRYPLLSGMGRLVDPEETGLVMAQAMDPCSVGQILRSAEHQEWKRRYLILWMLKHGLLQFVPHTDREGNRHAPEQDETSPLLFAGDTGRTVHR